jgi:hypothetical protein
MAGKCPLVGAGKQLVDLRNRDRIIEKVHDGRGSEPMWKIPDETLENRHLGDLE